MGQWLYTHGIEKSRIIVEDKALDTTENALNTYEMLAEAYPQVNTIAIVSSAYHVPWGALLFEAVFLKKAAEENGQEMHVVANAAAGWENYRYAVNVVRYETASLLLLEGMNDLSMAYEMGYNTKPER